MVAFYTNFIVPHQVPFAKAIVKEVGEENYAYVYTNELSQERVRLGYPIDNEEKWFVKGTTSDIKIKKLLQESKVLICDAREADLLEHRACHGRYSFYVSERWFKPLNISLCGRILFSLPGIFRLLLPSYLRMAIRFVKLLSGNLTYYLPQGIHAARDMARLCGLMHGDLGCMFKSPELEFERKPGGRIWIKNGNDDAKYCLDKMRMWGYFVEPTRFSARKSQSSRVKDGSPLRVLWVGRLLKLKHVDTIIRSVGECTNSKILGDKAIKFTLDIYGSGIDEDRLRALARKYGEAVKFHSAIPYDQVRGVMQEHDVYVFSSDSNDGWGAVVSEALEEGMKVVGTYEAGASATILPAANLYHVGDWKRLSEILRREIEDVGIGCWTAKEAAKSFLNMIQELDNVN